MLLVSYARTEDAQRIGGLVHLDGTAKPALIDLVFRNLAAVHGLEVDDIKQYYTDGDYFAWDWTHDPLTMGWYFHQITASTLLNCYHRCICVLQSGCVRRR